MTDADIIAKIRSKLIYDVYETVLDEVIAIANGNVPLDIPAAIQSLRATVGLNLLKLCLPPQATDDRASDLPGVTVNLGPAVDTVDEWMALIKEQKLDKKPKLGNVVKLRN